MGGYIVVAFVAFWVGWCACVFYVSWTEESERESRRRAEQRWNENEDARRRAEQSWNQEVRRRASENEGDDEGSD